MTVRTYRRMIMDKRFQYTPTDAIQSIMTRLIAQEPKKALLAKTNDRFKEWFIAKTLASGDGHMDRAAVKSVAISSLS